MRKAAQLTQDNPSQAGEEHKQASVDFARAAKGTSDVEALRILRLLEDQHQRLARIVQTTPQESPKDESAPKETLPPSKDAESTTRSENEAAPKPEAKAGRTTLANARMGKQARDSSPSLARDIAARRGIPQSSRNAPSPAAQARARQLSPESRRRASAPSTSNAPPSIVDSQSSLQQARKAQKAEDEEGFARFYSNLTSGAMSKLSTALAFAGLPLTADQVQQDPTTEQKSKKRTVSAGNDPDVKKIYSKAALDAIEDDHRRRGTLGHGFGPAESFYVVQKGGGTYSYADIARAQQQQQLSDIGEDEEAEFVDAREVPAPSSLKTSRILNQRRASFGKPKTEEELELENTILKQTLEQMTTRLDAFEAHAQDASMAALTQSMATLRPQAAQQPQQQNSVDPAMQERLRQLEKQVEQQAEERQKLETLATKQEKMLKKYHSKWEEIKKSAREKERVKKEKGEKGADDGGGVEVADDPS